MSEILEAKNRLLSLVNELNDKYRLSFEVGDDYYNPGNMEYLDQYMGVYKEESGIVHIRVDIKGLRYENRSVKLRSVSVGDPLEVVRDRENEFNSNNFNVLLGDGFNIGPLPAKVCNVIAPLYDAGYLTIESADVSFVEQLIERSRYAKQGVLFAELVMRICGV